MKTDEQKKVLSKFAILCGAAFMAILGRIQPGGCWVLCLEAFISLLQVGILGEVSGKGFSRIFISFPGVSLICLCVKMRAWGGGGLGMLFGLLYCFTFIFSLSGF